MENKKRKKELNELELGKYLAGELKKNKEKDIIDRVNSCEESVREFKELKTIWDAVRQIKEYKSIDVEKARKKVVKKLHGFGRRRNVLFYWEKIAAVLFIPLLLSGFLYIYFSESGQKQRDIYNELNVAFGTISQLVLADGTKVWLNSGTNLKYPINFTSYRREVYLEGEAYFEIAKNRHKPFIVKTSDLDVKVTGTSFNVMAYPEEDMVETTLIMGKASLVKELENSRFKVLAELTPGEKATFDNKERKIVMEKVDTDKIISWKEGQLIFRDDPMDNVVRKLGRWFNTDIELIDDELKSYRYTATFTDESLLQVLELLKVSAPIEYTYSPRTKKADHTFTKRRVEIMIK